MNIKSLISTRNTRREYLNTLLDFIKIKLNITIKVISNLNQIDSSPNVIYAINGYDSQGHFESSLLDLMLHVAGGTGHTDDETFTPLPSTFIKQEYRKLYKTTYITQDGVILGRGPQALKDLGLLERINFSIDRSVCYGFRLPKLLLSAFALTEMYGVERRGFGSNATIEHNHVTHTTIDSIKFENNGIIPNKEIYKNVLNKLGDITIDKVNFNKEYKKLLEFDAKSNIIEVLLLLDTPDIDELHEIARKYLIDSVKITNVSFSEGTSRRYKYTPRFILNSTGRLTEVNGIQGITRLSKSIIHNNSDVHNYDIRASQMCALLVCLDNLANTVNLSDEDKREYHRSRRYLANYVRDINSSDTYADKLNIGRDDWKRIIYSVVFGSNYNSPYSTAHEILLSYKNVNLLVWNDIKDKLFASVALWNKHVRQYSVLKSKDNMISNGLVSVSIDHEKFNNARSNRWLSAFWLQSLESKFIFNLITLIPNKLISYEYDGLVVEGLLDIELINKAKNMSGFTNAVLVNKPFIESSSTVTVFSEAVEYFSIQEYMENIMFSKWKLSQQLYLSVWTNKYNNKIKNAKLEGLSNNLTFDEYLFKAFEAGLTHPDQIGSSSYKYQLARYNDEGNYEVSTCRFITTEENLAEKKCNPLRGLDHQCSKFSLEDILNIFTDQRLAKDIAAHYNTSITTVVNIKNKITYTEITEDLVLPKAPMYLDRTYKHLENTTHMQGEGHGNAKLTNEQVKSIFLDTRPIVEISKDFNCSVTSVNRIKSGDRWSSVTKYLGASDVEEPFFKGDAPPTCLRRKNI